MRTTGAELIVATLERAGVEYVFGLCGHANLSLLDALSESSITFVPVRHEQVAAHMADGYFRFSQKPGVVLTTIGPGLANAVTGIWEAAADSSAVIVIAGNVPSYMIGRDAFQELSTHNDSAQADVYRPFVRRAISVRSAHSLPFVMQRAFNLATSGRPSPVLIDVPMDFLGETEEFTVPDVRAHRPTSWRVRGPRAEIERATKLLVDAQMPLIHVGNGAALSSAADDLRALAEYLHIPVTTSMQAQGIFDSTHPLSAGYPGAVGTPTGNAMANAADVVLAVGTRFSELETSSWDPEFSFRFGKGAKLIQVDIDPHEIGRAYPVEVGIIGDAGAVLSEMSVVAQELTDARTESASATKLARLKAEWLQKRDAELEVVTEAIRVEQVITEMARQLDPDAIVLADAGTFRHGVGQYFPITQPRQWFIPSGFGAMGGAPSAALGAQVAQPSRQIVCLVGDGGFSAALTCLATAAEQSLSVKWVVLNNHSWDSIETYQHVAFEGRVFGTRLETREHRAFNPDFVKIADAHGIEGARVDAIDDLDSHLAKALATPGPYVLDVEVAPTRLHATGSWDVGTLLRKEGAFKRERAAGTR